MAAKYRCRTVIDPPGPETRNDGFPVVNLESTRAQAVVPCMILFREIFARHRWKSLEFSIEQLNVRYEEP